MPQPISANDVLQVVVEGMCEQRPWAMIRHYVVISTSSVVNHLAMIFDKWDTVFLTNLKALLTDKWTAECMSIHRVAPGPRNVFYRAFNPTHTGAITTDGVPNDTAAVVRLNTDEPGGRNRGRVYQPGIPEVQTDGGLMVFADAVALEGVYAFFKNNLTDTGEEAQNVIFSRTAYGGPLDTHPVDVHDYTSPITEIAVQGNLGSMRRRRRRRNAYG